jgi:hypothetical protein
MKRRTTILGVATVLACTVVLGAQTQQRQDQQQQGQQQPGVPTQTAPSTQSQAPAGVQTSAQGQTASSMTFIGCVERGAAPNTFVLSVTEIPPASAASGQAQAGAGAGAAGATGAAVRGTAGTNRVGQRLQLTGGGNLAAHAGHKVQISGTMAPPSSPIGGQAQGEMRFNVSNVTMLAMTCTPATSTPGAAGTTGTTGTPVQEPEQAPQPEKAPQQETPKQQEQSQQQQN